MPSIIYTIASALLFRQALSSITCYSWDDRAFTNNTQCGGSNICCNAADTCDPNRFCRQASGQLVVPPCATWPWENCANICQYDPGTGYLPRAVECTEKQGGGFCCDNDPSCCIEGRGIILNGLGAIASRNTGLPSTMTTTSSSSSTTASSTSITSTSATSTSASTSESELPLNADSNKDSELGIGAKAGIAIGAAAVAILALSAGTFFFTHRRKQREQQQQHEDTTSPAWVSALQYDPETRTRPDLHAASATYQHDAKTPLMQQEFPEHNNRNEAGVGVYEIMDSHSSSASPPTVPPKGPDAQVFEMPAYDSRRGR